MIERQWFSYFKRGRERERESERERVRERYNEAKIVQSIKKKQKRTKMTLK